MKTKIARKRTAKKSAGSVPDAAPKLACEVHLHPAKLEIFNAAGELTDRLTNGLPGSDSHERNGLILADLHKVYAVTVKKFSAQGVEIS